MPAIYARLGQLLIQPRYSPAVDVRVTTSPTPPVPINLRADEVMRDIEAILVSWEERVRDVARLTPLDTATSRHRRGGYAVQQAADVLAPRVDALIALDAAPMLRGDQVLELSGVDAGLEILDLHWRARAGLPETAPGARPLPVPCGACGWRALREMVDVLGYLDGARCRRCGAVYDAEGLAALRRAALETARRAQ
jgi:hypothetical protein